MVHLCWETRATHFGRRLAGGSRITHSEGKEIESLWCANPTCRVAEVRLLRERYVQGRLVGWRILCMRKVSPNPRLYLKLVSKDSPGGSRSRLPGSNS